MKHDQRRVLQAGLRGTALTAVVALGLVAIVGSGGGSAPECSFFSDTCTPNTPGTPAPPATPAVAVGPAKLTVQVGSSATFVAEVQGGEQSHLQWQRSADHGNSYVDIPGATAASYKLAQTQFADDGAMFRVDLRANGSNAVQATSNAVTLLVSSTAPVVLQDGGFDPVDWNASAIADPAQNGPTHSEDQAATGGLPGAYRHMRHTLTAGPSSLRVFNLKASASHDPKTQGAVHAIDYSEDCSRLSATSAAINVTSYLLVEQAGRRYVSKQGRGCLAAWVNNFNQIPSVAATDLVQVDGAPCNGGEACPDFSAAGAPLRFGFERRVALSAGAAAGAIEHGIDNWKVTVWRD